MMTGLNFLKPHITVKIADDQGRIKVLQSQYNELLKIKERFDAQSKYNEELIKTNQNLHRVKNTQVKIIQELKEKEKTYDSKNVPLMETELDNNTKEIKLLRKEINHLNYVIDEMEEKLEKRGKFLGVF